MDIDFLAQTLKFGGDGYRCIPADRMMAEQTRQRGLSFTVLGQDVPPIVVFSSAMFMPAVVDELEILSLKVFGSTEPLGVVRTSSAVGFLGEEADIAVIDGSATGLMRLLLLERAWELALGVSPQASGCVELAPCMAQFFERRQARQARVARPEHPLEVS